MTITVVSGQEEGATAANATAVTTAFNSNVTAGNLIVVYGFRYSTSTDAFVAGDVTLSAGTATVGTISLDAAVQVEPDGDGFFIQAGVWSCIVTGTGSATMRIGALAGSYLSIGIGEYNATNGWDASRVVDTSTNSTTTNGTTSATTNSADSTGSALFAASLANYHFANPATMTEDAAFSLVFEQQDGNTHMPGSCIRRIVSGATTDSADWTILSGNTGWAAALAVLQEVAGAGGASILKQMLLNH